MPIIMIELDSDARTRSIRSRILEVLRDNDSSGRQDWSVTVDPSVYVVPGELSEDPAVFAREQDAQAFVDTYDPPRHVAHLLVCDAKLAAEMVGERRDDDEEDA